MLFNLSIWLMVGGLIGWVAGAALSGWILSPPGGVPSINDGIVSLVSICVSLVGATMLLAAVNFFHRGPTRAA